MARLVQPNRCEALAVDARQELDLKVGWGQQHGHPPHCMHPQRAPVLHPATTAACLCHPLLHACPHPQVGVAFTRFQSRFFQAKYGNLDSAGEQKRLQA